MRAYRFAALLPAMLVCAQPAGAEQNAAKIAITPESGRAAIIFKSPVLAPPPTYKTAYRLLAQVYDPVNQQMQGSILGGSLLVQAQPKLFVRNYLISDIKPGTYAFTGFARQDFWTLCFHDGSLQFTIKPGEVLYLGTFDASAHVREVMQKAVLSGRVSTRGEPVDFFDEVTPPRFHAPTDEELADVAAMMKTAMPGTTVAPQAVQFSSARFGTGSTLFGSRRCGGYFQEKAK
jgi:hypothetical protein